MLLCLRVAWLLVRRSRIILRLCLERFIRLRVCSRKTQGLAFPAVVIPPFPRLLIPATFALGWAMRVAYLGPEKMQIVPTGPLPVPFSRVVVLVAELKLTSWSPSSLRVPPSFRSRIYLIWIPLPVKLLLS